MSISINLLEKYREALDNVVYDTEFEDENGNTQTETLECSLHTVLLKELENTNAKLKSFVNGGEEQITKVHMNCKETREVTITYGIHSNGLELYGQINKIINDLKLKLKSIQQIKVSDDIRIIGTIAISDKQSAIDANNNKVYFVECKSIYEIKVH